ncbi:MAG TPA: glycerol-3-phosphate acyltransferase [Patescibacteria group bacterium]|nr:glycerol-3-phosphate acyltransferase [Patescibacteria group bacterium]
MGSFPTAYIVVKQATGKDIRLEETGNVGAMNTARTTGKPHLFLLVFLIDFLKGYLGIFLPQYFLGSDATLAIAAGAFGVVLGHCYSIYFKLKDGKFAGGKAIASLAGILAGLNFMHLLLPWGIAMCIPVILAGNLLLGQFAGTVALPFIGLFLAPEYFLLTILCAIPIFIKQWPRVIPALSGKEPKWYFKGKKK